MRHNSRAARATRDAYVLEQIGRSRRAQAAAIAGSLRARARAGRMTGLASLTMQVTLADANLIADVLNEWARRDEATADQVAITDRKAATR